MASCGPLTFVCVFLLLVVAASLAFAGDDNDAAGQDAVQDGSEVSQVYRRSVGRSRASGRRDRRRGNEGIAVDGSRPGPRRGGGRGGGGGRRRPGRPGGRRNGGGRNRNRGGRGHGRGRGRGRDRGRSGAMFRRRERRLVDRLTGASAQFALQLYNVLDRSHDELIFSPHSIHTAMTMTYLGARERTAKQMLRVLGLKRLRKRKAHLAYTALTRSLTDSGNVTLDVANAVFVKPSLPIEEAFRSGLQDMYRAEFDHFDFEAVGGAEAPINAWVSLKTEDKIQNLLDQGTITANTAMIIINAIYFKGSWKDKFDAEQTRDQPFYRDDGSQTTVPMMTRTGNYNYTMSRNLSAHVIEIPYQDGRFSMYVILPFVRRGLDEVERLLTVQSLSDEMQAMRQQRVQLFLPRFKSESKFSLKDTLKTLGMRDPFSINRANFSGICTVFDLHVSDVIHQAVVEVSEEGTEAAASTAVIIGLRSFPRPTSVVRAEHPFIYAIRDNISQAWIFMGKYSARD